MEMIPCLNLPISLIPFLEGVKNGINNTALLQPRANALTGRADRVLVKTGAAHRFLVSESLTLPRPGERAGCLTGHQVING